MYYALVHFPEIDFAKINIVREKYDPTFDKFDPHITILFPVPDSIGKETMLNHVSNIVKRCRPFPIHINGLTKSWDHWLFLTIKEGNSQVIELYHQLYSGILSKYKRTDISYIPHIGLGLFTRKNEEFDFRDPQALEFDEEKYRKALLEARALNLNYKCQLNHVNLLKSDDGISKILWNQELELRR
jgi:2'-5' RNA ligase